jgi:hypothetical protein
VECQAADKHSLEYLVCPDPLVFDSSLHEGDVEFATSVQFILHPIGLVYTSQRYFRHVDFDATCNWVLDSSSVPLKDKPRLLDLVNQMENDKELYIRVSWRNDQLV